MVQEIDLATERWEDFLKRYCWDELVELSNYYPEKRSLLVKFTDMDLSLIHISEPTRPY